MAGKDDIDTAAAETLRQAALRADATLAGYAGRLAAKLTAATEPFLAEPPEARELLKTAQTITGLARASITLHQAQAQEDKAVERTEQRIEAREVAKARARVRQQFNPDEDQDTDMNDRDPRLDSAKGVAEIYDEAGCALSRMATRIEIKTAERSSDGGRSIAGFEPVVSSGEGRATPAAH